MNLVKYEANNANPQQGQPEINVTTLEQFNAMINADPEAWEVQVNSAAGNSKYIPIGILYVKMDKIFIGLWNTKNFRTQVIANEIVGTIDLEYYHPFAKTWITREGSAAVMIMQKSGAPVSDINAKIKNTLQKDYPHLKAACEASAMRTIGKAFGRDLNRAEDKQDEYSTFYTDKANAEEASQAIDWTMVKTKDDLLKVWNAHPQLQNNKDFVKEFTYRKQQLNKPIKKAA